MGDGNRHREPMFELPAITPDDTVASYLRRNASAFATRDISAMFSRQRLRTCIARGEVVTVLPGVIAHAVHAGSFMVRAHAACQWAGGPLSGLASLFVWDLLDHPSPTIDVLAPLGKNPRSVAGFRVRRPVRIPSETTRFGLRVLTPAASIVCGFGAVPYQRREEVVFRAIRRRLVSLKQIHAELACTSRVPMRRQLLQLLSDAERGAESHLEGFSLRQVFTGHRFESFVRQHEVVIEGELFRLDMFDRATRLCVELDGAEFHWSRADWQQAIRRDAALARVGIQTVRFSYADLTERPEWCRMVLAEVMLARGVPRTSNH